MSSAPLPSPSPPEAVDSPESPPVADDPPPWRLWGATVGCACRSQPTTAVSIIGDVAFDLSFVAAALYFASLYGRPRPSDFGFRRVSLGLAVKAFVVAAISYYLLTYLYGLLLSVHGKDKLPSDLGISKSNAALVAAALFVCVIAPIAE